MIANREMIGPVSLKIVRPRANFTFRVTGIDVTMPGTPGLMVMKLRGDDRASISQADFLARAWSAASDKARALGGNV